MSVGILLAPILLISVVIYVAWPLLREKEESSSEEGTAVEIAREEKEGVISNLKDIEMDYRMGKLSAEDYESIRQEFEFRAVEAIQRLEALERKKHKSKAGS